MKTIYCRTTDKGVQTFYLSDGTQTYYLFRQDYRVSVKDFFRKGVNLEMALGAKNHASNSVRRTAQKLIPYIKYIETEMGIVVFDKKQARKDYKSKNKPYNRAKYNCELQSYYEDIA